MTTKNTFRLESHDVGVFLSYIFTNAIFTGDEGEEMYFLQPIENI